MGGEVTRDEERVTRKLGCAIDSDMVSLLVSRNLFLVTSISLLSTVFTMLAYSPLFARSSLCVPCSTMRPDSRTMIWSDWNMVLRRCAMVMDVRPCISLRVDSSRSASVSGSRLEVGSSMMRMGASLRNARARASRCACPLERRAPLSPMMVSYFCGSDSMNSCRLAACAAVTISSWLASTLPRRILAAIVSWKRCGRWGTHAME